MLPCQPGHNMNRLTVVGIILVEAVVLAPLTDKARPANRDPGTLEKSAEDRAQAIKLSAARTASPSAHTMRLIRRTSRTADAPGAPLSPLGAAWLSRDRIIIGDNNGQRIYVYDVTKATFSPILAHAQFDWPNDVRVVDSSIYVSDNRGLSKLSLDGRLEHTVRTFYQANSFAVSGDGTLWVNAYFAAFTPGRSLVVALDANGIKKRGLGQRSSDSVHGDWANFAYLDASNADIAVAHKFTPLVQVYGSNGVLVGDLWIDHPAFPALKALAHDKAYTDPAPGRMRLPSFLSGVRIVDNYLFIELDLPRPEVVVTPLTCVPCQPQHFIDSETLEDFSYRGFDVMKNSSGYSLCVLTGHPGRAYDILVYQISPIAAKAIH